MTIAEFDSWQMSLALEAHCLRALRSNSQEFPHDGEVSDQLHPISQGMFALTPSGKLVLTALTIYVQFYVIFRLKISF